MSVNPVSPVTFNGGQMTDLPVFTGTLNGEELLEIVAGALGVDLEADGVNYSVTTELLATLLFAVGFAPTIITVGATLATPYVPAVTETRILLNKTIPSDSYVNIGGGAARSDLPIMVRDIYGNADTFPISVSFTGTCDGIASPIVISSPYAGYIFNPLPNGNWFLSNA